MLGVPVDSSIFVYNVAISLIDPAYLQHLHCAQICYPEPSLTPFATAHCCPLLTKVTFLTGYLTKRFSIQSLSKTQNLTAKGLFTCSHACIRCLASMWRPCATLPEFVCLCLLASPRSVLGFNQSLPGSILYVKNLYLIHFSFVCLEACLLLFLTLLLVRFPLNISFVVLLLFLGRVLVSALVSMLYLKIL